MNLLSLLLNTMNSKASVNALSEKAGSSSGQTSLLISLAVPLLLKYLTGNASSQSGASSLLGALTQHTSKKSMASQLQDADEEDGRKIISHILGDDSNTVVSALSQQTGMSDDMVSMLLGNMAPALMSELSAAASTASASNNLTSADEVDFTDLFNTFEPEPQAQQNQILPNLGGLGFLGSLFGGMNNSSGLFGSSQSDTLNLIGNDSGSSAPAAPSAPTVNDPMMSLFSGASQGDCNGSSLLNILMSMMR